MDGLERTEVGPCGAVFATGQLVVPSGHFLSCPVSRNGRRGRTAFCGPVRSFSKFARQVGIEDEDERHSVVPSRLFLNLLDKNNSGTRTDEMCRPRRPLPSPTRICLRLWGLSSFLITAVLEIQGRGRTAFCRPIRSFSQIARQVGMKNEDRLRFAVPSRPGLLAVPPAGPYGASDGCEHCCGVFSVRLLQLLCSEMSSS